MATSKELVEKAAPVVETTLRMIAGGAVPFLLVVYNIDGTTSGTTNVPREGWPGLSADVEKLLREWLVPDAGKGATE